MQSIYLYIPPETEDLVNTWIYYRVTSTDLDVPAGTLFAPIEVCRVSWPTFEDIPPITTATGITRRVSAREHVSGLIRRQWEVDHEQSVLIGFLP
ncbi:MAG: hypothetical protein WCD43_04460 [Candidatus Acidiferrales bacterium]